MASKRKLSKSILEMKFMKRTKEKVEKEAEVAETKKMYKQNMSDEMLAGVSNYFFEPSYFLCENLKEGRLSFRGMNTELEKFLEKTNYFNSSNPEMDTPKQATEVDDNEMAAHYTVMKKGSAGQRDHLADDKKEGEIPMPKGNMGKPNRHEPPLKKAKFMKPKYNN